jgi:hypothetical protein
MDSTKPTIPKDLPSEPAQAYRRGWHDRAKAGAKKARSVKSEVRSAASRTNGAKGGRPKKNAK